MTRKIRLRFVPFLCFVLLMAAHIYAEEIIQVPITSTAPVIDGVLDDVTWKEAIKFENFKTIKPDYGKEPGQKEWFDRIFGGSTSATGTVSSTNVNTPVDNSDGQVILEIQ